MKSLAYALIAASALSLPFAAMAQTQSTNQPVTRAQVKQDLIRLEQAGYRPSGHNPNYPDDIQAAERRVSAQEGTAVANTANTADTSGYGGAAASSQSGSVQQSRPMTGDGVHPLYFGQ